ncbi:MAG: glycosyltransferase [Acidobacteria bacterium]|nr:glycosyltransferase [Acidobacteriota bacterium]
MPSLDLLLPTRDGAAYLPDLLDSLDRQTVADWRLLVFDDASADGTVDLLERRIPRDFRLRLVGRATSPGGPAAAVNELLAHSDAERVMFCDQDDVWFPDKVEKTLRRLAALEREAGPGVPLLVHTDAVVADEGLRTVSPSLWRYRRLNPDASRSFPRLLIQNRVTGCTTGFNAALRARVGAIPEGALMHDHWFALAAAAFGRVGWVAEPTLRYRRHGATATRLRSWALRDAPGVLAEEWRAPSLRGYLARLRAQARAFIDRFGPDLPPGAARAADAFARLDEAGWLARRRLIFRHRLFRDGLRRNLALLLLA